MTYHAVYVPPLEREFQYRGLYPAYIRKEYSQVYSRAASKPPTWSDINHRTSGPERRLQMAITQGRTMAIG
jgi:hypothetical protein